MQDASYRFGRRTFVTGSAALALAVGLPAWAAVPDGVRLTLCDRCHLTHLSAHERATKVVVFDGDLTSAWIDHVQPLWREGPAVIAGIASPAALFCLEQLARGERHRLESRTTLSGSLAIRFRFAPAGRGASS